jgi:hypothetical protein
MGVTSHAVYTYACSLVPETVAGQMDKLRNRASAKV